MCFILLMLDLTDQVGWSLRSVFVWFTVGKLISIPSNGVFHIQVDTSTATLFCCLEMTVVLSSAVQTPRGVPVSGNVSRQATGPLTWRQTRALCRTSCLIKTERSYALLPEPHVEKWSCVSRSEHASPHVINERASMLMSRDLRNDSVTLRG